MSRVRLAAAVGSSWCGGAVPSRCVELFSPAGTTAGTAGGSVIRARPAVTQRNLYRRPQ